MTSKHTSKGSVQINTIYNEDCLETMKRMPDNFVDLVLTSPPYNLGKGHHTGNIRHNPYSDDLPEEVYQNQQVQVLNELHRVTKDSLFYNHKNRIKNGVSITPYSWLLKTKWKIKQELIWFNRSQNFDKIRFYPMTERVYWLIKDETKFYNNINHHDLFKWSAVGTKGDHTRAFPDEMVKDFLACFPENYTIYDPFMGSGTTARACKDLGRNYIGSEISKEYCDIAEQRLKQEVLL